MHTAEYRLPFFEAGVSRYLHLGSCLLTSPAAAAASAARRLHGFNRLTPSGAGGGWQCRVHRGRRDAELHPRGAVDDAGAGCCSGGACGMLLERGALRHVEGMPGGATQNSIRMAQWMMQVRCGHIIVYTAAAGGLAACMHCTRQIHGCSVSGPAIGNRLRMSPAPRRTRAAFWKEACTSAICRRLKTSPSLSQVPGASSYMGCWLPRGPHRVFQ